MHLDLRGGAIDLAEIVRRELDRNCSDVLVQALQFPGAWDRDDPRPLGKQPSERELSRRRLLPSCDRAKQLNQGLIDLLGKIGKRKKATPAQIALAWLLAHKPWIVPIPGTTKLHRLDENIGAVAVELTPDDLREIDSAASKITVHGARYPEKLEQMTGR